MGEEISIYSYCMLGIVLVLTFMHELLIKIVLISHYILQICLASFPGRLQEPGNKAKIYLNVYRLLPIHPMH